MDDSTKIPAHFYTKFEEDIDQSFALPKIQTAFLISDELPRFEQGD